MRSAPLMLAILLVAFGLRVFRLGAQPLWADEVYSVAVARHPLSEVVGWVYRDNHPALYWLILYPVVHVLGDGALLVRFPSAVMGTIAVAVTYAAAREILGSRRAGLLAAGWLTCSPIHVVYSQEARMYAPLALFGVASTLFVYRGVSRGRSLDWVAFGLTAAAAAHSHNYGLLIVAGQGLWALGVVLLRGERRLTWGSALGLATFAACYGPMIPALMRQTQMSVGSTGIATWRDLLDFFEAYGAGLAGFSTPGLTPGRLVMRTALPSAAVTGAVALLGLLVSSAGRNPTTGSRGSWAAGRALLLGTGVSFPVVFVYGFSALMDQRVWQVRAFQVALGCMALLIGAGVASLRPRLLRWVACLGLVAVAGVNLYPHYVRRYKSTVPDAVAALEGRLGPRDVLFVAPYWDWTPIRYHYRGPADAIGGWQDDGRFELAGVGRDYVDLIDPRSLSVQSEVKEPVVAPERFDPDRYERVWMMGHAATPKRVVGIFGNDVTAMHYDVETRAWREVVRPYADSAPAVVCSAQQRSLTWDNGLRLLGYEWTSSPIVGRTARLMLYWTADEPQEHPTYLRLELLNGEGQAALHHDTPMLSLVHGIPMTSLGVRSTFATTDWPTGSIVGQEVEFDVAPVLPPLSYRVALQVVDRVSGETVPVAGQPTARLEHVSVARPSEAMGPQDVTVQHRTRVRFGDQIRLLGYDLPESSPRPGHHLPVWLSWMAEESPAADYEAQLRLLGGSGNPLAEGTGSPAEGAFPTSLWRRGDLARGAVTIPLLPDLEGGTYRLALRVVNSTTGEPLLGKGPFALRGQEWNVIGRAEVLPWPLITEPPAMEHRLGADFGEAADLLGYDLDEGAQAGEEIELTLYWKSQGSPTESYAVLVHLVDPTGTVVAQADGIPADWLRPTTTWREGEIIVDEHELTVPPELPVGTYQLFVGLYQPDGQRLPVVLADERFPDGRVPLKKLRVEENE